MPYDWKGTEFFDNHPYEFEKVYSNQCFTISDESGQEDDITVVGDKDEVEQKFKEQTRWTTFFEYCQMELPTLCEH